MLWPVAGHDKLQTEWGSAEAWSRQRGPRRFETRIKRAKKKKKKGMCSGGQREWKRQFSLWRRSAVTTLLCYFYFIFLFFFTSKRTPCGKRYATTLSNQPSAAVLSSPTMRSHNSWVPELSSYRGKIIIIIKKKKTPVYQENLKSLWYLHSVALSPAEGPQPLLRVWCQSGRYHPQRATFKGRGPISNCKSSEEWAKEKKVCFILFCIAQSSLFSPLLMIPG